MKKLLIGSAIGIVVGAGSILGLAQIPDVGAKIGFNNSNNNVIEDTEKVEKLESENSGLKNQVSTLNTELSSAKEQIVEKDNQIQSKNEEITRLTAEKEDLQTQLDNAIAEKEELEGLVGSDTSQLLSTISSLTSQLEEKTIALTTATAELEQLRVDKDTLSTRVSELELRLAQVEEELSNYKSLDEIEVLNIANFDGKWYVDGTFEDYYVIENGIVTHNASEDTGVIQCLNNQVYLFMNKSGSTSVNLSVDGTSFTLQDGTIYNKFYINTTESVVANIIDFIGEYSLEDKIISLNSDNTISYFDGSDTYYGAYVVTAEKRNIGGNCVVTNYISATLNFNDNQKVVKFEIVNGTGVLVNNDDNITYNLVKSYNSIVLSKQGTPYTIPTSSSYRKITVRTNKPILIKNNESVKVIHAIYASTYSLNGVNSPSYSQISLRINADLDMYNSTGLDYVGNYFEFYSTSSTIYDFVSINGISCEIVDIECSDSKNPFYLSTDLYRLYERKYNSMSETNKITCTEVNDYVNGSYVLNNANLIITSDGATIIPNDSVSITASSCVVTAKTDGYDIYQTATIKYSETIDDVISNHTIVINYKNNNVINSTIDGIESNIVKN